MWNQYFTELVSGFAFALLEGFCVAARMNGHFVAELRCWQVSCSPGRLAGRRASYSGLWPAVCGACRSQLATSCDQRLPPSRNLKQDPRKKCSCVNSRRHLFEDCAAYEHRFKCDLWRCLICYEVMVSAQICTTTSLCGPGAEISTSDPPRTFCPMAVNKGIARTTHAVQHHSRCHF